MKKMFGSLSEFNEMLERSEINESYYEGGYKLDIAYPLLRPTIRRRKLAKPTIITIDQMVEAVYAWTEHTLPIYFEWCRKHHTSDRFRNMPRNQG